MQCLNYLTSSYIIISPEAKNLIKTLFPWLVLSIQTMPETSHLNLSLGQESPLSILLVYDYMLLLKLKMGLNLLSYLPFYFSFVSDTTTYEIILSLALCCL
jgi:hypothetical protein